MEIVKATKRLQNEQRGIFAKSRAIESPNDWKAAKRVAKEMEEWLDTNNGYFEGEHPQAFAMAHAQVVDHDHPIKLFVVDKSLVGKGKIKETKKQNYKNAFFEAQSIFNAEVLETPDKILKQVPQRKVTTDPNNKKDVKVEMEFDEKEVDNVIYVPEGCMSFPQRKGHRAEKRYYRVKVRYQYIKKGLLGGKVETFEGYVDGLKAHIFQHECQHFDGEAIYYRN